MQVRPQAKPLRPAFLGILACACFAAVVLWYFFIREGNDSDAVTETTEQQVDVALLRSPAFQELVLPRGFPIEASTRFGRPNPFAPLTPLASSTPPVQATVVVPAPPLEIVPLVPFPPVTDAATTTPFSL
ncbi:hypothetical protein KBD18_02510 [Patescibacteria group bacterium]|nr:hypothetical protein [Patescibacteria group bacterium]